MPLELPDDPETPPARQTRPRVSDQTRRQAARLVATHAHNAADCAQLLAALGIEDFAEQAAPARPVEALRNDPLT